MSLYDFNMLSLGEQHDHVVRVESSGATKEIHAISFKNPVQSIDVGCDVVEKRDADSPFTSMNFKSDYISEDVRESSDKKEDSIKKIGNNEHSVKNRKITEGKERRQLLNETCPRRLLELSKMGTEKIKREKTLEVLQKIHNRKKDIMLEMSWKRVQEKKSMITPAARGIHERLYIMSAPMQTEGKQRMEEIARKIYLRNKTSRFHGEQMRI